MFSKLSSAVFQLSCGSKRGTAFLISENLALTVFHAVKEFEENEIILSQLGNTVCSAKVHDCIKEKHKVLDVALLVLDKKVENETLDFAIIEIIKEGTKWVTRGYPASKGDEGDNILEHDDNIVNQHLPKLKKNKIDIQLEHNQKLSIYEGFSGAPLIINNKVVGIINSELKTNGDSKELNALSVKYFQDLLINNDIAVSMTTQHRSALDHAAYTGYTQLESSDTRDLKDKLCSVYAEIPSYRINNLCREMASGILEMEGYDEQKVIATKYRVFEVCQKQLMDFVENKATETMTIKEINDLIDQFARKAASVISDRSSEYNYPLKSHDFLKRVVLVLINDCFLSFDERGIYDK